MGVRDHTKKVGIIQRGFSWGVITCKEGGGLGLWLGLGRLVEEEGFIQKVWDR